MSNFFDQFDSADSPSENNFFDQFDEPVNRFDEPAQEKILQPAYKSQKPVSLADTANLKTEDLPDFYNKTKDLPLTPLRKSKDEEGDAQMLMSLKDGTARLFAGMLKTGAQNEAMRGKGQLSSFETMGMAGNYGGMAAIQNPVLEDVRQGRKAEESHLTDEEFHAKQVAQYEKSISEADSVANTYRVPDENDDFYDPELNSFSFDKTAENYRNNSAVVGTLKTADQIITAGMEALAGSAPYMLNAPATAMSIAGDTTETRRANNGDKLPSGGDALIGLGVGFSVGALERVLPKFITRSGAKTADEQQKAFDAIKDGAIKYAAANTSKEAAKAGGMEFATEFSQGVIQYLGEKVGTDAAVDFSEMLKQSAEQGIVGSVAGASTGVPSGAIRSGADILDARRSGYQVSPEAINASKNLNRRDAVDQPTNNEPLPEYSEDSLIDDLPPESVAPVENNEPKFEEDETSFLSNIDRALKAKKQSLTPDDVEAELDESISIDDEINRSMQELKDITLLSEMSFAEKAKLAGKAQGINPIAPDLEILPKAVNQLPDKVDYAAQKVASESPAGNAFDDGELSLNRGDSPSGLFGDMIRQRQDAQAAQQFNEQQKTKLETPVKTEYPQANFDPEEDAGFMGEHKRLAAQSQFDPVSKESQPVQDLQDFYPPETKRQASKADSRVDAKLPGNLSDSRLTRPEYRSQLEKAGAELVEGGNVTYIRNENDQITGRTKSVNADWFKSANENPETSMSVIQAKAAVQKALAGEKLGVREARVVGAALDSISGQRGQYAAELIAQRQQAKEARQAAYDSWRKETNVPDDAEFASMAAPEYPGETYSEQDYEIDLDYDDRSTSELVDHAIEMGASWKDVDAALELDDIDQQSKTLTNLIWSSRNEHRQQVGSKQREAGTPSGSRESEAASNGLAEEAPNPTGSTEAESGITETNETKPSPSAGVSVSGEPEIINAESSQIDQLKARVAGKNKDEQLLEFLLDVIENGTDTMSDGGWPSSSIKPAIELSKRIQSAMDSDDYSNIMDDAYQSLREMLKSDDFTEFPELIAIEKQLSQFSLEAAANEAATSPANNLPEPTEAQKEAGNYRKGHTRIHGLDIAIENPKGSIRSGTDSKGKKWEVTMDSHYGYIKKTEGADGDHVDVFIGPNPGSDDVFVVDQMNPNGSFDEHKVMIGYDSPQEAKTGYLKNYSKGWKVGPITAMSMDQFKEWLKTDKTKKPLSIKNKEIQNNSPQSNEDITGEIVAKIPPKFLKKIKVDYPVYSEETKKYETEKVDAKDALKSVNEDIEAFESLLKCVRGG
jgi:hypothetical protein